MVLIQPQKYASLQARDDRAEMAAYWEEHNARSKRRKMPGGGKDVRARHVSLPQRRRAARGASGRLHGDRHRLPLQRMRGETVHAPDGLRQLRLPAEEAAHQRGRASARFTEKNIANFRRQLKMLGFSYDWEPRDWRRPTPSTFAGHSLFSWCCSIRGLMRTRRRVQGSGFLVQVGTKVRSGSRRESIRYSDDQTPDTRHPDNQTPRQREAN